MHHTHTHYLYVFHDSIFWYYAKFTALGVYLVQYALAGVSHAPQELISGRRVSILHNCTLFCFQYSPFQFSTTARPFLHFNFTTGDPFHYQPLLSGSLQPQEVALSPCLGLACLAHEVFSRFKHGFFENPKSQMCLNIFALPCESIGYIQYLGGQLCLVLEIPVMARMTKKANQLPQLKWGHQWESML